jgi:hypothetical protein
MLSSFLSFSRSDVMEVEVMEAEVMEAEVMEVATDDSGLQCLQLLLRFHQISIGPDQIKHRFSGPAIGVTEMLRCARELKR